MFCPKVDKERRLRKEERELKCKRERKRRRKLNTAFNDLWNVLKFREDESVPMIKKAILVQAAELIEELKQEQLVLGAQHRKLMRRNQHLVKRFKNLQASLGMSEHAVRLLFEIPPLQVVRQVECIVEGQVEQHAENDPELSERMDCIEPTLLECGSDEAENEEDGDDGWLDEDDEGWVEEENLTAIMSEVKQEAEDLSGNGNNDTDGSDEVQLDVECAPEEEKDKPVEILEVVSRKEIGHGKAVALDAEEKAGYRHGAEDQKLNRLMADELRRNQRVDAFIKNTESHCRAEEYLDKEQGGRPRGRLCIDAQLCIASIIKTTADFYGLAADSQVFKDMILCTTVEGLAATLLLSGFNVSCSTTHLHLLPKDAEMKNGKHHIKTIPVASDQAGNACGMDEAFCSSTANALKDVCSWFGPQLCNVACIDVQPGTHLPNNNGEVVLRPCVSALCTIIPDKLSDAVSHAGPTYVALRSCKYDTSLPHMHDIHNFKRLFSCFKDNMCDDSGAMKPILVLSVSRGQSSDFDYQRTLEVACHRFRTRHLDVLITMLHPPGCPGLIPVRRRMASLSQEFSGLILPQDFYGTHLDASSIKTDIRRHECQNIQRTGKTLSKVWSQIVLDGYDVCAEFVDPEASSLVVLGSTPSWIARHVRQSQYLIQIVKCSDLNCCREWRSNWTNIVQTRFLPAPLPIKQGCTGLVVPEMGRTYASLSQRLAFKLRPARVAQYIDAGWEVPYDLYCPSMTEDEVKSGICNLCHLYFPSIAALKRHRVCHTEHKDDQDLVEQTLHARDHEGAHQDELDEQSKLEEVVGEREIALKENGTRERDTLRKHRGKVYYDVITWQEKLPQTESQKMNKDLSMGLGFVKPHTQRTRYPNVDVSARIVDVPPESIHKDMSLGLSCDEDQEQASDGWLEDGSTLAQDSCDNADDPSVQCVSCMLCDEVFTGMEGLQTHLINHTYN